MRPIAPNTTPRVPGCVIHCRVSTSKQAYEGESLDVQASICADIAISKGWRVVHEPWKESFSGRKLQRPIFQEVLAFLDAHPSAVQYYLFRSIDRATRGGSFSYEQIKRSLAVRGVEMVDSYGLIQPVKNTLQDLGFEYEWSMSSPSEIAEVVVATSAKADLTNILTRIIGQEIRLRQRGYKVRQAVDGFVNARIVVDGRKRVIEQPDPERAKYYIAMFEMRAAGQFTDSEICERINAMGFRSRVINKWDVSHTRIMGRKGGTPLTPKRLQEIIRRPIYCGIICEKWTRWLPIKAAYDGLVSIETFNAANRGKIVIRQLSGGDYEIGHDEYPGAHSAKRSRENPAFLLRKVILCPTCRKPLLGSSPRGGGGQHFPTYHCARRHKYFGVRKAVLESAVQQYVSRLRFRTASLPMVAAQLHERYRERAAEIQFAESQVRRTAADLEQQKADAVKAFTVATTDVMRRGIEAQVSKLERDIEEIQHTQGGMAIAACDIDGFLADAQIIMEQPAILLNTSVNALQLETLYSATFEAFPTYLEIANGTAKLAWIFYVSSDSETIESALVHLRRIRWNEIEETILKWKKRSLVLRPMLYKNNHHNVPNVPKSTE